MKKNSILIGGIVIIVIGLVWFFTSISYNNQEKDVRNRAEAQRGKVEVVYDQMFKILQQKAGVTNEYKEAFKDIYPALIEGRYSQGDGSLMKWIQESNPNFDTSLYKDLMRSIEVERNNFTTQQTVMLDIMRQHTNLLTQEPSSWFIKNKEPIQYTIISSTKSKETMQTGLDDDIDLFKK